LGVGDFGVAFLDSSVHKLGSGSSSAVQWGVLLNCTKKFNLQVQEKRHNIHNQFILGKGDINE